MRRRDHLFSSEVRALAAVIALACIVLLAVALSNLGAFLLKRIITLAAIGAAALAMSACNGVGGLGLGDQTAILNAVNAHIEGCERHYHGQTVPPSLSVQIDCPARPGPTVAVPALPAPQAPAQ